MERVAILMATYNGEKYLQEQLDSLVNQSYTSWDLFISDDGSTDQTVAIIKKFAEEYKVEHRIEIFVGPHTGFGDNFLSLLPKIDQKYQYFAFCDQDDIWLSCHLSDAISWLSQQEKDKPALWASSLEYIDQFGNSFYPRKRYQFHGKLSFENALIQCFSAGNSMVFNQSLAQILISRVGVSVFAHDWWAYQLVTAVGGQIHYSKKDSVLYRQHTENVLSGNLGLEGFYRRIKRLFSGKTKKNIDTQLLALKNKIYLFTPEAEFTYMCYQKARALPWYKSFFWILRSRINRPGIIGIIYIFLIVFKKV